MDVTKVAVPKYKLTVTEDEATVLLALLGGTSTDQLTEKQNAPVAKMWHELRNAGVEEKYHLAGTAYLRDGSPF